MVEKDVCRVCSGKLKTVLDLGSIYPSTFENKEGDGKVPLVLTGCSSCNLIQLKHTVDLDLMYRKYWYKSSLNNSMIESLRNIVQSIEKRVKLDGGDVVVDLGCNDGTLFTLFNNRDLTFVGYDPAYSITNDARKNSTVFINDYFTSKVYPLKKKAKIVTSIAMFYDLENPVQFIKEVKEILANDGLWVIQFTDLASMLKINAFDNICHEHLEYYSLEYLYNLMLKQGLEITDVEHNNVNGGSLRVYIEPMLLTQTYVEPRNSVMRMLVAEKRYFESFDDPFVEFANRVKAIDRILWHFIIKEYDNNKKIFVLGASTKGNTLLQIFHLDNRFIEYAAEVNPDKFGLKTVGTNIPIIPEKDAIEKNPDYFLVLPWHFTDFFINKFTSYLEKGGKLIVPLPIPAIIENKGGITTWTYL